MLWSTLGVAGLGVCFIVGMEGSMRRVLGLVGATLLLAGPALAADLAVKAPRALPPGGPVFSWTGCYVGGFVGGASGNQRERIGIAGAGRVLL